MNTTAAGLKAIFNPFPKTSGKNINGDYSQVGKYVDYQFIEVSLEIYIHGTKSVLEGRFDEPLTTRKVTNILSMLAESIMAKKLSGEAWFKRLTLSG